MIVHDNEKYEHDHSKRDGWNAISNKTDCNATFKSKTSLDDHVIRKHPDFISSVTSKLYVCTKCTFKTVKKSCFSKHLLKHPGIASDFKHSSCIHCNATFKSKMSLDDHVVRKHPDFISSITNKLRECTKCPFKTVQKVVLISIC
nr:unnamed protein product [Callosobruchus analis]